MEVSSRPICNWRVSHPNPWQRGFFIDMTLIGHRLFRDLRGLRPRQRLYLRLGLFWRGGDWG
jgi:hypothetical protein